MPLPPTVDAADQSPASTETAASVLQLDDKSFLSEMGLDDMVQAEGSPAPKPKPPTAPKPPAPAADEESEEEEEEVPAEEEEGEGGESPTDEVEESATVAESPKLAAEFTLKQGADELEFPKDLVIEFKAGKKEHKLPLDKVVRLAQNGFHNEALQKENEDAIRQVEELETDRADLQERTIRQAQTIRRLLSDEAYLEDARERFAAANSPEARAERAEREAAEARQALEVKDSVDQFRSFVTATVEPALQQLLTANPDVDREEVLDRYAALIRPLVREGRAPRRSEYRKIEALIAEKIEPYVVREQARANELRELRQKADESTRQTERVTKKLKTVKRAAAGAIKPAGRGGAPSVKPRQIVTMQDATADIIEEALRGI